ncbi:ankyrin repeat-containing domain protein [Aspergillus heterothallicus]
MANDGFQSVPIIHDVLSHIWNSIPSQQDRNSLARTCRYLHIVYDPQLYSDVVRDQPERVTRWATERGPLKTMKKLIGAGLDVQGMNCYSPLCSAAEIGRLDLVKFLICDQEIDPRSERGPTRPLTAAIRGGNTQIFKMIIHAMERGVSRDTMESCYLRTGRFPEELSRLGLTTTAIECDRAECLGILLDQGIDMDRKDRSWMTPLAKAIQWNKLSTAELLLDRGASMEALVLPRGMNALYYAATQDNVGIARLLLKRGFQSRKVESLVLAASRGSVEMARLLLAYGADFDAEGCNKIRPLDAALDARSEIIVVMLMVAGLRTSRRDKHRIKVAGMQDVAAVADKVRKGSQQFRDNLPLSLLIAVILGQAEIVRNLLDCGLDFVRAPALNSLLRISAKRGHVKVAEALLEKGADHN